MQQAKPADSVPGSGACSRCHSEIYDSYQKTVMATASGLASDGLITGEFDHKPSGVRYRVFQKDGRARSREALAAGLRARS